jgi:hypothetical protein
MEEVAPSQMKEETSVSLHACAVGAPATSIDLSPQTGRRNSKTPIDYSGLAALKGGAMWHDEWKIASC